MVSLRYMVHFNDDVRIFSKTIDAKSLDEIFRI